LHEVSLALDYLLSTGQRPLFQCSVIRAGNCTFIRNTNSTLEVGRSQPPSL
jgi:hypothetical protein